MHDFGRSCIIAFSLPFFIEEYVSARVDTDSMHGMIADVQAEGQSSYR
jgi:hypothetical protein